MSEEEYKPRQKPVLDKQTKKDLSKRNRMSHKRPSFKRQNWFRYKRLGEKWRRPRGIHSKMRRHFKYRIPVAQVGFRGPASVRGLHPSGFEEVLVHNTKEVENINPETQAVRISSTVGDKKRELIVKKADELKIRVFNRRDL
tara:strand:+ start:721 stop:1146 length:426 start_codon:yes stop_codon:yes gene_type:complete